MDTLDSIIANKIKNATARQRLPIGGRARLLKSAAASSRAARREINRTWMLRSAYDRRPRTPDWGFHLLDWVQIDAFNTGAINFRMIL